MVAEHFSIMKRFIVLLILLIAAYFGFKKWSPRTLDKLAGALPGAEQGAGPADPQQGWIPAPEAPPAAKPGNLSKTAPPRANPAAETATVTVDKTAQVVVLCYHRVEGSAGGTLSIAPDLFRQHMQRLRDSGIHVISMQDFLAWRRNEKNIPAKSALITIDDGYVSAFEVARPILKEFGYPWTFFIYTKYVGTGGKSVAWEQLAALREEGVEIGAHTISHLSLRETRGKSPEAYDKWLHDEIIGSKELLEKKLGIKCDIFAYPEGKYSPKVLEVVKAAGFSAAFTVYGQRVTHGAASDRIGRYAWYSRRPQDMEMALNFTGPLSASEPDQPAAAELAAAMMLTQPMNGDVIHDPVPILKANLSSFGSFDENSLIMRLSGSGPIPFKYDRENKIIEAKPPQALKPGEHTVVVSAKVAARRVETQWTFRVDPTGGLSAPLESFSATPPGR